jgi:hypothetical protein
VIVLGGVILLVGFLLHISILWTIGLIVLIIGGCLLCLRPAGPRGGWTQVLY